MMFMMMSKFMMPKLAFMAVLAVLAIAPAGIIAAEDIKMEMELKMEDSTVSPIADMAIIDAEMKTSTERPPVMEAEEKPKQQEKPISQRHTVADFIIHPLIAFKPRNPEDDGLVNVGKQASTSESTSTTTPSPWQLFGFNAGQGLGSSVSSSVSNLAGQVSGWLNDRIQFPGLVETPVRESTTTTTTTTTPRPDVVVRVQHKASTRRPLIAIDNRNRPNRPQFESEENNDDDEDSEENENENDIENFDNEDENDNEREDESPDDNESSNEASNEVEEEGNNSGEEETDDNKDDNDEENDDDAETTSQRPNNRRRPIRNRNPNGQRRRVRPQEQNNRRRTPNNRRKQQQKRPAQRRRPAPSNDVSEEEVQDDDSAPNNEYHDDFYYDTHSKRSQSSPNFIQRGQQQLINQIRQLTRGQSPSEIGNVIRKAQRGNGNANKRRRQQATLFVNRNGQTIYVAPELSQMTAPQFQQVYAQPIVHTPAVAATSGYPQPPLTVPLKRNGQPTQYITIPWAQLGISPPNNLVSITEGIQGQPLILNIPQSAINTMQSHAINRPKKKRPQVITADAVPLLAEASLMDIFKPPQIPPSRTTGSKKKTMSINTGNVTPVLVSGKPSSTKTSSVLLQQHIRPATVIETAPEVDAIKMPNDSEAKPLEDSNIDAHRATGEKEYIIVGHDDEPGLTRQVQPVFGDARYVRLSGNSQYYDVLPRRRFSVRRGGRELVQPEDKDNDKTEQHIPVEVVSEPELEVQKPQMSESAKIEAIEVDKVLSDPKPAELPASIPIPENNQQQSTPIVEMTT